MKENIDKLYQEAIDEVKKDQMDWQFEDFLNSVEENNRPPIVTATTEVKKSKPILWWYLAAGIAFVFTTVFLVTYSEDIDLEKDSLVQTQAKGNTNKDNNENNNEVTMPTQTVEKMSEKDSVILHINPEKEAEKLMNNLLPKKGRLKKQRKGLLAKTTKKQIKIETTETQTTTYQSGFVTINGYQVKNEKEAMELTQYTLHMLNNKMAKTAEHTHTVAELIEF